MTKLSDLLGRRAEREAVDTLLAEAQAGRSGSLVLRGEAGIGKTAMIDYARACAIGLGFRVEAVVGVESETQFAFAGLHQLCSTALHGLDTLPEPQATALGIAFGTRAGAPPDRFLVGLAILNLLAELSEQHPLLCIVDDAQWLDEASAQILAFVTRRLSAERIALVFALRDGADADGSPLRGLPETRLAPLTDTDARALLGRTVHAPLDDRVRDRIVAESRGNPLALLELPQATPGHLAGEFDLPVDIAVPGRVEDSFRLRSATLPPATQALLLLAATEPTGDVDLLWRAADRMGISRDAAAPAETAGLLAIEATVRFHHPLVRSAIYQAGSPPEQRAAHRALAASLDPVRDADRRAWHRAQAVVSADEDAAADLERLADRAQARGGVAAAGAFLERAAEITPDPARRGRRSLEAAHAKHASGRSEVAMDLLTSIDAELLDPLDRARSGLLDAEISFHLTRGEHVPGKLLQTAAVLSDLDATLARDTYLRALDMALVIGPGNRYGSVRDTARAARSAPPAAGAPEPPDLLLDAVVTIIADGFEEGVPALREAAHAFCASANARTISERDRRWLWLASRAALALFDERLLLTLSAANLRHARSDGALARIPAALLLEAVAFTLTGDTARAGELIAEETVIRQVIGSPPVPHAQLILAAWRGQRAETVRLHEALVAEAETHGLGAEVTLGQYSLAVLHNARGEYEKAERAASLASASSEQPHRNLSLPELVEAASRTGNLDVAVLALEAFEPRATVAGTPWALGLLARSRALVDATPAAERHYVESLEILEGSAMASQRARGHLLYGEWLRRAGRRQDARGELRIAHELLSGMGLDAFSARAARELRATGEHARKRSVHPVESLTAQEKLIARLVATGATSREVGAQLFLSPRTIEAHLRNIFRKLDISSRRQLREMQLP